MHKALAALLLLCAPANAAGDGDLAHAALAKFPGSAIDREAPSPEGGETIRLSLTGDLPAVSQFFAQAARGMRLHLLQPAQESFPDFRIYVFGTDEHPAANLLFVTLTARSDGGVTALYYEKHARP